MHTMAELTQIVDAALAAYAHLRTEEMDRVMLALSALQFETMNEMIPTSVQELWREGLREKKWAFKICGAGGGGYMLVYRLEKFPQGTLIPF
jgi:mevalonate kinase